MKLKQWALLVLLFVATGLWGRAPATQPVADTSPAGSSADVNSSSGLQIRAMEEFNQGRFDAALPLLKKLALNFKSEPDQYEQVQEKIRVCERNIKAATIAKNTPAQPPAPPTAADQRKAHEAPKPGEMRELEIKELGNFDYDAEKGGGIPTDVKALSGMNIKLHGFMIPMDQASSITQFALVPSLFSCCFGQPPAIQHTIIVHTPAGKGVSYYPDEIVVQGKLSVDEKKEDGFIVSVFEVSCDSVKPAAK